MADQAEGPRGAAGRVRREARRGRCCCPLAAALVAAALMALQAPTAVQGEGYLSVTPSCNARCEWWLRDAAVASSVRCTGAATTRRTPATAAAWGGGRISAWRVML